MGACISLETILPLAEQSWTLSFLPVRQDSAAMLVIIAFRVNLPIVAILPDKLPGIFVNIYFRRVICVCLVHFYNPYHQFAVADILDDLAGVTVCHTVSTAAPWLHDKLMPAMWANCFVSLLYPR